MKTKVLGLVAVLGIFVFAGCENGPNNVGPKQEQVKAKPAVTQEAASAEESAPIKTPAQIQAQTSAQADSNEVTLAKCLTEKGAKLYTASWCGHCKKQKEAFGDGLEYLDNTDCAEEKGWSQTCKDLDIAGVPTWIFADGTRKTGETSLPDLAKKAGCTY